MVEQWLNFCARRRRCSHCRSQQALGDATSALEQIRPSGQFLGISADIANPDEIAELHHKAESFFGSVEILVNNAGTSNAKPFLEVTDADWLEDFSLKFFSAAKLCQLCIPGMQPRWVGSNHQHFEFSSKSTWGKTCPTSALRGWHGYDQALVEFASDGILVNALNTGFLVSHQWRTRWQSESAGKTFDEFVESIGQNIPIGRMGEAHEFANLALFLASDGASYLTGASINIDSGLTRCLNFIKR